MNSTQLWERYRRYLCVCESIGLSVDISRMNFGDGFFARMAPAMDRAFDAMEALEAGAIANHDENRREMLHWSFSFSCPAPSAGLLLRDRPPLRNEMDAHPLRLPF